MSFDRDAALVARFGRLLAAWLDGLQYGWQGTPRELAEALDELNLAGRYYALVPRSGWTPVLQRYATTIRGAGCRVTHRRTATARLITFAKLRERRPCD